MAVTSVNSGIASVEIIAADPKRSFAAVENTDANTLYLKLGGGTASATSYSVSLASGDYFEIPRVATGLQVTGIWSADGTGAALVTTI